MPTFAIGDVHGCATALHALLKAVPIHPRDTLVMLGDYVDRGPASREVIETLLKLRNQVNLVTLRGNHEVMMLWAYTKTGSLNGWRSCGGEETLASYGKETLDGIPPAHWAFIENTGRYHEAEHHFFVHASVCPDVPLPDQPDYVLYWEHLTNPLPHQSGKIMVCGHTPQLSGHPLDLGHTICIDTAPAKGGWLTCLEVESRIIWQANESGEIRTGPL